MLVPSGDALGPKSTVATPINQQVIAILVHPRPRPAHLAILRTRVTSG